MEECNLNRPEILDNDGPAHVFMATTELFNMHLPNDPTVAPFQVPSLDVENLFNATMTLDFGEEVTPVQIWVNLMRIASNRSGLTASIIRLMTDEFARYVQCNRSVRCVVEDLIRDSNFA
jgi:hypothetical protein